MQNPTQHQPNKALNQSPFSLVPSLGAPAQLNGAPPPWFKLLLYAVYTSKSITRAEGLLRMPFREKPASSKT